jgi:hypothetical protein
MKRLAVIAALAVTSLVTLGTTPAAAQQNNAGIEIPIIGTAPDGQGFTGTFTLSRFAVVDGTVAAVGRLTGTVTRLVNGVLTTTSIVRNVTLPLAVGPTTCDILHLELGPLDLDLLGLVVHLDRIVLDIDAQSGPGNLLGNLLCGVAGLLDNPGGLARLLNQILSILG